MHLSAGLRLLTLVAMLVPATATGAFAQGQGSLIGRIISEVDGQPIPDASIELTFNVEESDTTGTDQPTPVETTTDSDGGFTFDGIQTGPYVAMVTKDGYQPVSAGVRVNPVGIIYFSGRSAVDPIVIPIPRPLTILEQVLGVEAFEGLDVFQLEADLEAADATYADENYRDAVARYSQVLEVLPDLAVLNLQIGNAYRAIGADDEALVAYKALAEADPTSVEAKTEIQRTENMMKEMATFSGADLYSLADLAFAQDELSRAGTLFERAARLDPTSEKPVFKLAVIALKRGHEELAKQHYQKVVELAPDSEEAAEAKATLSALP